MSLAAFHCCVRFQLHDIFCFLWSIFCVSSFSYVYVNCFCESYRKGLKPFSWLFFDVGGEEGEGGVNVKRAVARLRLDKGRIINKLKARFRTTRGWRMVHSSCVVSIVHRVKRFRWDWHPNDPHWHTWNIEWNYQTFTRELKQMLTFSIFLPSRNQTRQFQPIENVAFTTFPRRKTNKEGFPSSQAFGWKEANEWKAIVKMNHEWVSKWKTQLRRNLIK